jgi:hypothetical protein
MELSEAIGRLQERDVDEAKLAIIECMNGANSRVEAVGKAYILRSFIDEILTEEVKEG